MDEKITPRQRFLTFAIDWLIWWYMLAAVIYFFFLRDELPAGWNHGRLYLWAIPLSLELSLLISSLGTTIGQRLMGIRVTDAAGQPVGPGPRLVRFLALQLSLITVGLGSLWMFWGGEGLTWHDRLSGTRMVAREEIEGAEYPRPWYLTVLGIVSILLAAETLVLGWQVTEINLVRLFTAASKMTNVTRFLIRPDWSTTGRVVQAMIETVFLALMATAFAIPIAAVLSFFAARNLMMPIRSDFGPALASLVAAGAGVWVGGRLTGFLGGLMASLDSPVLVGILLVVVWLVNLIVWLVAGGRLARLVFSLLRGAPGRVVTGLLGALFGAGLGWVLMSVVIVVGYSSDWAEFNGVYPWPPRIVIGAMASLCALGAARMGPQRPFPTGQVIYYTVRTILNATRSVEALIWAIIFVVWVRIGPFPGMMALMVHSIAALGKLYSEQIESIDQGPLEAVTASGANRLQTIVYAVVPQIIPPYTAFTIYRWDINVRMSTIVGFVGGGGIGQRLQQAMKLLQWRDTSLIILFIIIVVWTMDFASAKIRERII